MELLMTNTNIWLFILAVAWILPWKGVALWKAARLSHRTWFIVLLLVNSLAILDIIYIFFIANRYKVETTEVEESPES